MLTFSRQHADFFVCLAYSDEYLHNPMDTKGGEEVRTWHWQR